MNIRQLLEQEEHNRLDARAAFPMKAGADRIRFSRKRMMFAPIFNGMWTESSIVSPSVG